MIFCRFGRHPVDALDYLTHEREDGATFMYCTLHEPLTDLRREKLEAWVAAGGPADGA